MDDLELLGLDAFDFDLPEDRIALAPAQPRESARLLQVGPGPGLRDGQFSDLLDILCDGDALVVNDSRVIRASLKGARSRGDTTAAIQINLHKRLSDHEWLAFAKPAKRLAVGDVIVFGGEGGICFAESLQATVAELKGQGEVLLGFEKSGAALDEAIDLHGEMPLPPYISSRREPREADKVDYQTIYSRQDGSVAAPTAGLHFSNDMLEALKAKGVKVIHVTLHVGAGTFLPVKCERISEHKMHAEWGEVSQQAADQINEVKNSGGRVFAVGTTSLRLLETAARASKRVQPFCGETDIFITPGFQFHAADCLLTNFHLPKSTLFMLVCAFAGLPEMQRAYAHAIDAGYRFYSYGDACLLSRAVI